MSGTVLELRRLYNSLSQDASLCDDPFPSPLPIPQETPGTNALCTAVAHGKMLESASSPETSSPQEPPRSVGLVWDARMLLHKSTHGPHIERPERLSQVIRQLRRTGLMDDADVLPARMATFEDLRRVHTKGYLRKLMRRASPKVSVGEVSVFAAEEFEDVFLNEHSLVAAVLAAGSSIAGVEAVVKGSVRSAFAVVRPPGHHAEAHCAMGFCVFNNVAVAAAFAVEKMGVERVLIVDWDVHHGNGTQRAFANDSRVCYFSVHRFDKGRFFPGSDSASAEFTGKDGTSVNVCWEGNGYGDQDYLAAWDHVLIPVAKTFNPQLILVSAGFDAAVGDPIGQCCVTPHGYRMLTSKLQRIGQGRIVMIMEGGYNLESLGDCVHECVAQLMEGSDLSPPQPLTTDKPLDARTINAINKTITAQQPHWPQLQQIS